MDLHTTRDAWQPTEVKSNTQSRKKGRDSREKSQNDKRAEITTPHTTMRCHQATLLQEASTMIVQTIPWINRTARGSNDSTRSGPRCFKAKSKARGNPRDFQVPPVLLKRKSSGWMRGLSRKQVAGQTACEFESRGFRFVKPGLTLRRRFGFFSLEGGKNPLSVKTQGFLTDLQFHVNLLP